MTVQNLWGDLVGLDTARTPAVILQEQAGLLGKLTDEVLSGEVRRNNETRNPESLIATLYVVAQALQQYSVSVVRVDYSLVSPYPVNVESILDGREWKAGSQKRLEEVLGEILSSDVVRKVISSLIAESQMSRPG